LNNRDFLEKTVDELISGAAATAGEEIIDELPKPQKREFSDEHEKKMNMLFKKYERKMFFEKLPKYSGRVAVVLLAFVLVSGISVFSVDAWRIKFMNYVLSVTETHTEIRYNAPDDVGDSYVTDEITLGYIPEGFELESRIDGKRNLYLNFIKDSKNFTITVVPASGIFAVDTENADIDILEINGCEAFLSKKENTVIITWCNDEKIYSITSNLDKEEVIKIAQNIE